MAAFLWQLFDAQGRPKTARGATKHAVVIQGLLHGAVHVWFWRRNTHGIEVLLQKRAATKINWPSRLDKSAGGHMAFGELPLETALRKIRTELGIVVAPEDLTLAAVLPWHSVFEASQGLTENELQWVFTAKMPRTKLSPDENQIEEAFWKPITALAEEATTNSTADQYVPYGTCYYDLITSVISHHID